jgi:hypothetical protein
LPDTGLLLDKIELFRCVLLTTRGKQHFSTKFATKTRFHKPEMVPKSDILELHQLFATGFNIPPQTRFPHNGHLRRSCSLDLFDSPVACLTSRSKCYAKPSVFCGF